MALLSDTDPDLTLQSTICCYSTVGAYKESNPKKKESIDSGTEERKKIQAAQSGIQPEASRFAYQCSNH